MSQQQKPSDSNNINITVNHHHHTTHPSQFGHRKTCRCPLTHPLGHPHNPRPFAHPHGATRPLDFGAKTKTTLSLSDETEQKTEKHDVAVQPHHGFAPSKPQHGKFKRFPAPVCDKGSNLTDIDDSTMFQVPELKPCVEPDHIEVLADDFTTPDYPFGEVEPEIKKAPFLSEQTNNLTTTTTQPLTSSLPKLPNNNKKIEFLNIKRGQLAQQLQMVMENQSEDDHAHIKQLEDLLNTLDLKISKLQQ